MIPFSVQVPPSSLANRQKKYFDDNFSPFFRVNQVKKRRNVIYHLSGSIYSVNRSFVWLYRVFHTPESCYKSNIKSKEIHDCDCGYDYDCDCS